MRIQAKCPQCGCTLRLGPDKADKRVRCTRCRKMFKIPNLERLKTALDIVENAAGTVYVDQNGNIYA